MPLKTAATHILTALPRSITGRVFPFTKGAVEKAFLRACARAGLDDVNFHDLRHEAISRVFERGLSAMDVATISGHTTLQTLKRYTCLRAKP